MQTDFSVQTAKRTVPQIVILVAVAVIGLAIGVSIGRWILPEGGASSSTVGVTANAATRHRELEWQAAALGQSASSTTAVDTSALHRELEWEAGLGPSAAATTAVDSAALHRQLEWQTAIGAHD